MNTEKLESNLKALVTNLNKETFIYDLLMAYELPKAAVTRLQKGDYNISKVQGEILWKKKLFFKKETDADLHHLIDKLRIAPTIIKQHPRFIVVTDFQTLLSVDTKTGDTLDISISELPKHYDFFLPWAGLEKAQFQSENPADVKAAERMGRLYDIILEDNPTEEKDQLHALNIFLSRLLFCFFAEDTGIFQDNQFTNALASHTADDGSDLQTYLHKLFAVLNLSERPDYPQFLQDFPYVNGGLFADDYPIPTFRAKSRKIIIECGALDWKEINPDIFGSMIQAVVHNDQRSSLGMHYTSVTNIMKVIEPLFLNDLYEALEKAEDDEKKLIKLLGRLYNLRIFDPACGSGNFLIIAYKELCKLEINIFRQLQQINALNWGHAVSGLQLNQFYGIELDDFAHETAKLSLWLTAHQMNLAFKEVFGETRPTLPLQDSGNIVCGNATRLDWEEVCPKTGLKGNKYEVYILGNPPYLGAKVQNATQKDEVKSVFKGDPNCKTYDYICCWFAKAGEFIKEQNSKFAFVSTNSICQGEQVVFWENLKKFNIEINFAHTSFKWKNNARGNAGVICIIVGMRNITDKEKFIYLKDTSKKVTNINYYLVEANDVIVKRLPVAISNIPPMLFGSIPYDGGNLILTNNEKKQLILNYPESAEFIRLAIGASELIKDIDRWCLWIDDDLVENATKIPPIKERIEKVRNFRLSSKTLTTNKAATYSHRFKQYTYKESNSDLLLIPRVSSENREYLPIRFYPADTITVDAQVIYNSPVYLFSIVSSKIHMTWMRVTSGRLKSDIRYSSALCYNNFPFPEITEAQKTTLEDHVFKVLDERELHSEKTMAQLYDPDKMPAGLRLAHHEMDVAVEQCYRPQPFKTDEERLEYLFNLYEEMILKEGMA